ncbi:MAG TPA: response regulator, partial [Bryobacteraceae bacterium]|nr:response regulator [Bryobacteraceae bacterium]
YISIKFPVPDPESGAVAVCGISTDITERKRLEEKMRESAKLESLGILAGGIAHDFNNLLTGILGYASLLTMETSASGRVRHLAGEIISGGQRAAQLTNQMLAYAGKGKFIVEAVDISRQAAELADLLRAALPKNVRIVLDLADDLPCVEADASQLQQVIMNLVINGAEAMSGQHGTVTVRTCLCATESPRSMGPDELPPGRYVGIAVSDTGSGMDASTMARIFDPFFTTKFTGRGLGLAAVQGIVRSHGGGISVTSAPGKGTTFEVCLPVSDGSSRVPPVVSEGKIATPPGEGLVLVVDDEEIVRSTVSVMLARFGYSILEAADGAEAIHVFEQHADRIHVVLLDMMMPVMSGGEALARLRARNAAVPVIAMSGYTEEEAKRHFGDGVCSFIQKPFTVQRLHAAVEPVLAKGRPASGNAREPGGQG